MPYCLSTHIPIEAWEVFNTTITCTQNLEGSALRKHLAHPVEITVLDLLALGGMQRQEGTRKYQNVLEPVLDVLHYNTIRPP